MSRDSYTVVVSTRGRITIPAELRRKLEMRGGQRIRWRDIPGGVEMIIEPAPPA